MTKPIEISDDSVPSLPQGVRLRHDEARGQWVLLGPERVLKLDDIALQILKRCDGTASLASIVADLAAAFDTDSGLIESDVRAFFSDLQSRGMLVLS